MNPETSGHSFLGSFRPPVPGLSRTPLEPNHKLESILGHPLARKFLNWTTTPDGNGTCAFERLFYSYDNPALTGLNKWRWGLYSRLVDCWLNRAGLDKGHTKFKLFHHPPRVKALVLTARSVARFDLAEVRGRSVLLCDPAQRNRHTLRICLQRQGWQSA